jgi:hypothetical protein
VIEKLSLRRRSKQNCSRNYQPDTAFLPLRHRPRPILLGPDCYSLNRSRTPKFDIPADTYDGCIGSILCVSVSILVWSFGTKLLSSGHENQFGMNGWNWVSGVVFNTERVSPVSESHAVAT